MPLLHTLLLRDRPTLDAIDFGRLTRLRDVSVSRGRPDLSALANARCLTHLGLIALTLKDLHSVPSLPALEDLVLMEMPIKSLAGVERFPTITSLALRQLPIADLAGIQSLHCSSCCGSFSPSSQSRTLDAYENWRSSDVGRWPTSTCSAETRRWRCSTWQGCTFAMRRSLASCRY